MVNLYVMDCEEKGNRITWTGMALFMGFAARACIDEYQQYDGFSYSVKRAKTIVEHAYEQALHGPNTSGPRFALQNLGWSNRQDIAVASTSDSMSLDEFYKRDS